MKSEELRVKSEELRTKRKIKSSCFYVQNNRETTAMLWQALMVVHNTCTLFAPPKAQDILVYPKPVIRKKDGRRW